MPRDIPIGNGRLLISFDGDYSIRDIYFPCCGKENHAAGHKFRFGVWAEGVMSWIDRKWNLRLDYAGESLVTHVVAENPAMGLGLHMSDCVDFREDIYIKTITVKNLVDAQREARFFFHHDFHIHESADSDTAYYDPEEKALIHYKTDRYFLVCGMREGKPGLDQFATGRKEFGVAEGTWRDAEDGLLGGNPIEQGSVDSTVSFWLGLAALGEKTFHYWICAGRNYAEVSALNRIVKSAGPERFTERTVKYWKAWAGKEEMNFAALPEKIVNNFKRSLLVIRTNVDEGGAIVASIDSDIKRFARDTYNYMWPRDAALVAYALDQAGFMTVSRRFFRFCHRIISRGKETGGFFLHKYNPDGTLGSSWHPWISDGKKQLPIQEDSTGLVLWALWNHFDKSRDVEFVSLLYEDLIARCADFMLSYRDIETGLPLPSYDLWEERWGIHTYTVSAVYAGLRAAESFALLFDDGKRAGAWGAAALDVKEAMERYLYDPGLKRFLRNVYPQKDGSFKKDTVVDASTYAPFYFGVLEPDDEMMTNTMKAFMERLQVKTKTLSGGFARYEDDAYYRQETAAGTPGNPWFICTLWLAQWHIAKATSVAELGEAVAFLEWVAERALPSGVLAEQINPRTNEPLSVSPLTWSHATFVSAVLEYLYRLEELDRCPACGNPVYRHDRKQGHPSHPEKEAVYIDI